MRKLNSLIFVAAAFISSGNAANVTFYEETSFKGSSHSMDFEGLACFNLPASFNDKASSINTHDNCILAFENSGCGGREERIAPGTPCHDNLGEVQFDNLITSFRQCSPSYDTCRRVVVDVDTSEAPDMQQIGQRMKETMEEWYPFVCRLLYSPTFPEIGRIRLWFDGVNDGVAGADAFNKIIVAHASWFRNHPDDIGALIHEMAHVIQRYTTCAGWLTEGIADYPRRWWYEPVKPEKPSGNFEGNSHTYFLRWIDDHWPNSLYEMNRECREGVYNDGLLERLTGKNVEQLWEQMMRE